MASAQPQDTRFPHAGLPCSSRFRLSLGVLLATCCAALAAQEPKTIDPASVDPRLLGDMFGRWEVRDATGRRRCMVTLGNQPTIGGMEIDVASGCAKTFPVMGDIAAWTLLDDWGIGFSDATRKLRIRFFTPDERYIAQPEVDGVANIVKQR